MATDYLTFEQVCEKLGKSADEVRSLVAEGKLSEIRDGDTTYYRPDAVDTIAAKEGSSIVDLALSDEIDADEESTSFADALSSLADASSGLGVLDDAGEKSAEESESQEKPLPEMDLDMPEEPEAPSPSEETAEIEMEAPAEIEPIEAEPAEMEPAELGAGDSDIAELNLDDIPEELPAEAVAEGSSAFDLEPVSEGGADSGEVPDLGLSGSSILGLDSAAEQSEEQKSPAKEDTHVKVGISVFDDDEIDVESDPMGETQISAGVEELETVGSGSGLLDLTRESDDTSLGAELLDVISPTDSGETQTADDAIEVLGSDDTVEDSGPDIEAVEEVEEVEEAEPAESIAAIPAPRVSTAAMPGGAALNVCMLLGVLAMALLGLATAGFLQGVWPRMIMDHISEGVMHYSVFGGAAAVALIIGVVGILAGRGK